MSATQFDWIDPWGSMSHEAKELALFIENDQHLWMNRRPEFWRNLDRKERAEVFDADKAVVLLRYLSTEGAKKYHATFAGSGRWHDLFPVSIRTEVAKYLVCVWSAGEHR